MADTVEGLVKRLLDYAGSGFATAHKTDCAEAASALEALVVERDEARRQLKGWSGFYARLRTAMDEGSDDHQKVRRQARLLGEQASRLKRLRAEVRKLLKSDPYTANQPFTYRGMIRQNSINFAKFKAAEARALAAEGERDKLAEALTLCQSTLAMMVEPDAIRRSSSAAAYAQCVQAEARARSALADMGKPE